MNKRKSNWSSEELQLLVDSCSTSTLINAKLSGSVTAVHKDAFWDECTERVNSVGVCGNRTKEEVKKKWTDTKSSTKRKAQVYRKELRQTGGGPAPSPLKEWEEKVVSFLPNSVIDGILEEGDIFQEMLDKEKGSATNHSETLDKEEEYSSNHSAHVVKTKEKDLQAKKRKLTDVDDYTQKIINQGEEKINLKRQELAAKETQNELLKEILEQQRVTNNILIRILESSSGPVQCVSPVIKFRL